MKINQNGRSMVEMLGVLAIIGILSAGALAGYSKAMFRHRVNQTIDIFQGVLQRFAELEQKQGFDVEDTEAIVQYGFLPSCKENENGCELPLGTFNMAVVDDTVVAHGQFQIRFTDSKSCIAFASAGWENAAPIEWFNPIENWTTGGFIRIGDTTIYDPMGIQEEAITKVEASNIIEGCKKCDEDGECLYYFVIRGEL